MTEQQVKDWKIERDIARQSGDPKLIQLAYDHRDDMLVECISHQSDRVKRLVVKVDELDGKVANINEELKPCKDASSEYATMKERAKGAGWLMKILIGSGLVTSGAIIGNLPQILKTIFGC